jgi:hypothetical protein
MFFLCGEGYAVGQETNMKKRNGGQPGNRNALKHGIYARHYSNAVKKAFKKWDLGDFGAEIQLLRAGMDKTAEGMFAPGAEGNDHHKEMNAIAHGVDSLVKAAVQQALLNPREDPILAAWAEVEDEEEFFEDGRPTE